MYCHTLQLNVSEETVRMSRIICEQQDIAFFRFSPLIGKDVGTLEKDNCKLCDIIIKLVNLKPKSLDVRLNLANK